MHLNPDEKIDWFRIITDLERSGYSHFSISVVVNVGKRTVGGWKNGATPRWEEGEQLLSLWETVTKKGRETAHKVNRYSYRA